MMTLSIAFNYQDLRHNQGLTIPETISRIADLISAEENDQVKIKLYAVLLDCIKGDLHVDSEGEDDA